jgi:hypothetical protein
LSKNCHPSLIYFILAHPILDLYIPPKNHRIDSFVEAVWWQPRIHGLEALACVSMFRSKTREPDGENLVVAIVRKRRWMLAIAAHSIFFLLPITGEGCASQQASAVDEEGLVVFLTNAISEWVNVSQRLSRRRKLWHALTAAEQDMLQGNKLATNFTFWAK